MAPFLHRSRQQGFTLIELLVVVAIIGILATVLLTNIRRALWKAKEGATYQGLSAVRTAIDMYTATNGFYPQWLLHNNAWAQWADPRDQADCVMLTEFKPYMEMTPEARVRDNGFGIFADGNDFDGTRGIYYAFTPDEYQVGNNRGWFYYQPVTASDSPTAQRFIINNDSLSTEGKRYVYY